MIFMFMYVSSFVYLDKLNLLWSLWRKLAYTKNCSIRLKHNRHATIHQRNVRSMSKMGYYQQEVTYQYPYKFISQSKLAALIFINWRKVKCIVLVVRIIPIYSKVLEHSPKFNYDKNSVISVKCSCFCPMNSR